MNFRESLFTASDTSSDTVHDNTSKVGSISSNHSHKMFGSEQSSCQMFVALPDNTLDILTKRGGFSRQKQEVYLLPIIISDSGSPPMSSTSTLTIKVCGCSNEGIAQSCNAEAYVLPIGLSMGALIAILACIILLLGMYSFTNQIEFQTFVIHKCL